MLNTERLIATINANACGIQAGEIIVSLGADVCKVAGEHAAVAKVASKGKRG